MKARAGFTLVELIMAMTILVVGVLALATGSAGVLRQMRAGNQAAIASFVAQSRMEVLRSQQCSIISSGSATTRGLAEAWTVATITAKIKTAAETVTYAPRPGITRKFGINMVIPCA
jgi:prepilin-type N-terminal cleavage/methylation domain-containing protein